MITERDVGFKVRVINRTDAWNGRMGILLSPPEDCRDRRWPVRIDGYPSRHGRCWFMPDQLERVDGEIGGGE